MDKKIFLLDKSAFTSDFVSGLTEDELENIVSKEEYFDNADIIKIDANGYKFIDEALENNGCFFKEDYYIISFGF